VRTVGLTICLLVTKFWLMSNNITLQNFDFDRDQDKLIAIYFNETNEAVVTDLAMFLRRSLNNNYKINVASHERGFFIIIIIPKIELVITLLISIVSMICQHGDAISECQINLTREELQGLQTTHEQLLNHLNKIHSPILFKLEE
jgi:hypothetical protein